MDIKNFVLSYYKNSTENFHFQKTERVTEAKKPHSHDYFQIYYVKKGSVTHFVDGKSSALKHGDMFIVPPGAVHYIEPEKDMLFFALSFMPDFIPASNPLASGFLTELQNSALRPRVSLPSEDIVHIESVLEHIYREFAEKPLGFADCIRADAVILITTLARYYFEETGKGLNIQSNKDFVLHCVDYVKNNFSEHVTLEKMTRRSMMSKNAFCSLFKSITGETFNSYLNRQRIEEAARLIEKGYSATDTAFLCGYSDFSTFYRNFTKIMGVSPSKYKSRKI